MFKLSYGWAIILMVFAISFAGCDDDDDTVTPPGTITEIASDDDRFTILTAALVRTGLDVTLNAAGTFTVFAPTDAAFTASGIDLTALSDADLTNVLLYHVLGGVVTAADLGEGDNFANTLGAFGPNGSSLSVLVVLLPLMVMQQSLSLTSLRQTASSTPSIRCLAPRPSWTLPRKPEPCLPWRVP
jgi:transforming growth factor-beta-induced protein